MLDTLRKSTGGIIAKIFLGLLVLSFAVWGIADIFTGFGSREVATVGSTEIGQIEFQRAFQNETQRFSRQIGRPLALNEARQFGIDQRVLAQLISQAALDEDADRRGVNVSEDKIAADIVDDPTFNTGLGNFSRVTFDGYLNANGLSEAGYVAERRDTARRQQVAEAVAGGIDPSLTLQQIVHQFQNEARVARFLTLEAAAVASSVADPDETTLTAYFDANKSRFQAPEYRSFSYLLLEPDALADTIDIGDEDLATEYDARQADFATPERRTIRQIPFESEAAAAAAKARIDGGLTFDALAQEMNLSAEDTDLGTLSRAEMFNEATRDAAFALDVDAVSDPVTGQFRPVLLLVTEIQPAAQRTFDEVKDTLRRTVALERAGDQMFDLFDAVEDDRAAGLTLKEIGNKPGLRYAEVAAIDRTGRDESGTVTAGLPVSSQLIAAVFDTDVGIETDPLQVGASGSVWFDATEVTPARERTLDEVRSDAVAAWRAEKIQEKLTEQARDIRDRTSAGEALSDIAQKDGLVVTRAAPLKRSETTDELGRGAIETLFAQETGAVFDTVHSNGEDRLVVMVASANTPPYNPSDDEATALADQMAVGMIDDLLGQYIAVRQADFGARINQQAINLALGITADGQP